MFKILTSIILLMTMGFSGCGVRHDNTDAVDGGVKTYNSGEDSPKTIASTEIVSFNCKFSLVAMVLEEESQLDGRVYALSAVAEDEGIKCKVDWHDRSGNGDKSEFTADASFMEKLQEIVAKHNFAQYNGYSSRVSGLPDMYGAKLDISYASGESIYAYDNQSCFIPFEAIKDLAELFCGTNQA